MALDRLDLIVILAVLALVGLGIAGAASPGPTVWVEDPSAQTDGDQLLVEATLVNIADENTVVYVDITGPGWTVTKAESVAAGEGLSVSYRLDKPAGVGDELTVATRSEEVTVTVADSGGTSDTPTVDFVVDTPTLAPNETGTVNVTITPDTDLLAGGLWTDATGVQVVETTGAGTGTAPRWFINGIPTDGVTVRHTVAAPSEPGNYSLSHRLQTDARNYTTAATVKVADPEPPTFLELVAGQDRRVSTSEVLDAIAAYNGADVERLADRDVTAGKVLNAIAAYNSGNEVSDG